MRAFYRMLERPGVYDLSQRLFGLGREQQVQELFRQYTETEPTTDVLELGCGTGRWTVRRHRRFVRTDVVDRYFPDNPQSGVGYKKADATDLSPLGNERFDLVYSMGLYHHLSDRAYEASLSESIRVLRLNGRIVLFDAILPTNRWNFPALLLRRLDRGGWVRSLERNFAILAGAGLVVRRYNVCRWGPGLEGCFFELHPAGEAQDLEHDGHASLRQDGLG